VYERLDGHDRGAAVVRRSEVSSMKLIKVGLFDDAYKRTFLALASPAAYLTKGGGWRDIRRPKEHPDNIQFWRFQIDVWQWHGRRLLDNSATALQNDKTETTSDG
jgi:hypothetical protein